jgi:hypothetical protein
MLEPHQNDVVLSPALTTILRLISKIKKCIHFDAAPAGAQEPASVTINVALAPQHCFT